VGNFLIAFTIGALLYIIIYFYLKNHPIFVQRDEEITIKIRKT
jgi:hypothetical protein